MIAYRFDVDRICLPAHEFQGGRSPKRRVFDSAAVTDTSRLPSEPVKPPKIEPIDRGGIEVEAVDEMIEVTTAREADAAPTGIGKRRKERLLERRPHAADDYVGSSIDNRPDQSIEPSITVYGSYDSKMGEVFLNSRSGGFGNARAPSDEGHCTLVLFGKPEHARRYSRTIEADPRHRPSCYPAHSYGQGDTVAENEVHSMNIGPIARIGSDKLHAKRIDEADQERAFGAVHNLASYQLFCMYEGARTGKGQTES
jgi:hypothetical protein